MILLIKMLREDAHFSWGRKVMFSRGAQDFHTSCSPTWSWCFGFKGINIVCSKTVLALAEPLAFHPHVLGLF